MQTYRVSEQGREPRPPRFYDNALDAVRDANSRLMELVTACNEDGVPRHTTVHIHQVGINQEGCWQPISPAVYDRCIAMLKQEQPS